VPLLQRTLEALDACPAVDVMAVVVNPEHVDFCRVEIVAERFDKVVAVVGGGAERPLSVRNGLRALEELSRPCRYLGVHDGARPFVVCSDIDKLLARLDAEPALDGAILAVPSLDTVKLAGEGGLVAETLDRARVWSVQTPQVFPAAKLLAAYAQPEEVLVSATDDSSLVEALGGRVALVEGARENIKITTPLDLSLAERILTDRWR
jgi:2-C-methyl-D-erythritol 4-phosphate cytidylyltransferase